MPDLVHINFLGQAGFIVRTSKQAFVVDPYLSNYVVESGAGSAELFSREFAIPVNPDQVKDISLAFITHDHADHCDPLTLLPMIKTNQGIVIVGPRPVANHLLAEGVSEKQIFVPEIDQMNELKGTRFYAVPAAHYGFDQNEKGEFGNFGFVINVNDQWLYHSGDTILYDGMVERILQHTKKIKIACLPVNGRDGWRERMGMIGNLDGAETLELVRLIHAEILLPMHNDLFKVNHVNPAILADLADRKSPRQKIHWLQPGEDFFF